MNSGFWMGVICTLPLVALFGALWGAAQNDLKTERRLHKSMVSAYDPFAKIEEQFRELRHARNLVHTMGWDEDASDV